MHTDQSMAPEEESFTSSSLEKMPKLNLPPKPVLASTILEPQEKQSSSESREPTLMVAADNEEQECKPSKKIIPLTLPVAIIAIIVALLALVVQLLTFLNNTFVR